MNACCSGGGKGRGGEGREGEAFSTYTVQDPSQGTVPPMTGESSTSITVIQVTPPQAEAHLLDARFSGVDSSHHPTPNPHLTHVKARMGTLCQLDTHTLFESPCLILPRLLVTQFTEISLEKTLSGQSMEPW